MEEKVILNNKKNSTYYKKRQMIWTTLKLRTYFIKNTIKIEKKQARQQKIYILTIFQ